MTGRILHLTTTLNTLLKLRNKTSALLRWDMVSEPAYRTRRVSSPQQPQVHSVTDQMRNISALRWVQGGARARKETAPCSQYGHPIRTVGSGPQSKETDANLQKGVSTVGQVWANPTGVSLAGDFGVGFTQ